MNHKLDISIIKKYLSLIILDDLHRYKSWDFCYQAFTVDKATDNHVLQLAFYLASWGMYRGSCGLLQKNHLIHEGAVEILFLEEFRSLKCNQMQEATKEKKDDILRLRNELTKYYKSKKISTTDTLISKIILGTFGCVPAYDTYFKAGLKEKGLKNSKFNDESLIELFDFINHSDHEIIKCQQLIKSKIKSHYPVMKIVDMYFWQIGYDIALKDKTKRNTNERL